MYLYTLIIALFQNNKSVNSNEISEMSSLTWISFAYIIRYPFSYSWFSNITATLLAGLQKGSF